jgi:hypothetical protein
MPTKFNPRAPSSPTRKQTDHLERLWKRAEVNPTKEVGLLGIRLTLTERFLIERGAVLNGISSRKLIAHIIGQGFDLVDFSNANYPMPDLNKNFGR